MKSISYNRNGSADIRRNDGQILHVNAGTQTVMDAAIVAFMTADTIPDVPYVSKMSALLAKVVAKGVITQAEANLILANPD